MEDSTNNTIKITTENIKLDSCLKLAGIVSTGGEAKEIIKNGKVFVSGEQCLSRGKKLKNGDVFCVDGTNFYEVKSCEDS